MTTAQNFQSFSPANKPASPLFSRGPENRPELLLGDSAWVMIEAHETCI
jgi:hypothetical protein